MNAWPVFGQPRSLLLFAAVLLTSDLALLCTGLWTTELRLDDAVVFAALVGCAAVCVEAMRRLGMPRGIPRDLLGAWWIPTVLLLPPIYALLIPIPVFTLLQYRIRRTIVFRRVCNAGVVALSGCVSSSLYHATLSGPWLRGGSAGHEAEQALVQTPGIFVAAGAGVLFTVVTTFVLAIAVRLSSPEIPWRRMLWDRETALLDGVEVCVGLMAAVLCGLSVVLLAVVLPPVLLLQRSLMYQQLQTAARTDPKTGLLNAVTWEREAAEGLSLGVQANRPAAVLIIDIDHFKRVNDTHGHLFGDQVLLGVAGTLTHQLRQTDLVGRFGGEEFVVLLPGADLAEACRIAERLRSRVGRMALPVGDTTATITVSIGIAMLGSHGDDLIELLAAADLALYRAKDSGRNRVCLPVPSADAARVPEQPRGTLPADGGPAGGVAADNASDPATDL
ncbi:diguanylate cyclase (GGDEF)-like protein [Murinocardiopsis flavida]|uniref:Diguanylate cyclase (GGDEF)-like protein n=1 Tax=Murinocardiopsis flavida TaxID=645275 RepID=A0A2P8DUE6_9ACTN|nr:diguanylate cyclase (GGDEF)-like protein [Murinocardiopsis flavida]